MSESYRAHFKAEGAAQVYEASQYGPDSYWNLIWLVEQEVLDQLLVRLSASSHRRTYLDFACGTGRVLSYLEARFDEAYGIDVSSEMLARARERAPRARLIQLDVTRSPAPEVKFDLITAFRFVLNAEPELRRAALGVLAGRLGPEGRLILNTHGNPWSFKALVWPLRWVRSKLTGSVMENFLSIGELRALVEDSGMKVEERRGVGVLPWQVHRALPRRWSLALERFLTRSPLVNHLGVDQILLCRRMRVGES